MKYYLRLYSRVLANILLIALTAGAAFGQYPATGNKQRLGFQTTGDGLVYRGRLSDTTAIKPANINNAFYLQDTINDKLYRYIKTNGGWQPVQGRVQKLGVGADGPSSAILYLSDTDTEISSAVVVVDGLSTLQLPGVNNTVVGIVTVTTVQHGVTVTGTGLAVVTETAQGEDGQITISVIIPSGYVTPDMLQSGTVDTLTTISVTDATSVDTAYVIVNTINALELPWDGNSVVGYVASGGGIKNAVYLNVNGKNILIQGGGAMDMSANDAGDILTITSATNVVVQQVTGVGRAYSVVDAISTVRLPWDGNAILAVTEEFVSNDVTLTINDTTVTFKVGVTDGDKSDITVAGDTWTIKDNAVQWTNLDQATRDSIALAGFSMPVDSITFNNNETDPDSLELQYNYDKGSLVYGANGGVEIPLLPGHWYVRNDTTVTLTKGTVVRATGTLGNSGRIKVKHMIADGSIDAMYLLGITAHDIAPGADGYVMWQGKIRKINTNAYTEGAVLYADDFIPGALMETPPSPSKLKLPIAFVVHKATNGTIAVRVEPGNYLRRLHDVGIQGAVAGDVLKLGSTGIWQAGKDSTIYKFDGTLTGNRTMYMNGFQMLFKDTSDIYDYVDIRENYVSVGNTLNDNVQTMNQYGFANGGFISPNQTEIRMEGGIISMYANNAATASPSIGADLRINGDGKVTFRVSAGGTLDSLYGKNAQGELTAIDRDVFYSTGSTVPVSNGGTGLTTFGGAGRVPYSTGATGTGLQFDTTFFVDPTNRNFIWGGGARNGSDNINIGTSNITARQNNGVGNINIGTNAGNNLSSNAFYNINIGNGAGINLTTGDENVSIGIGTGSELTSGSKNTYIGPAAGRFNASGSNNIAIGADIYSPTNGANKTLTIGNLIFGVSMDSTGTAIPVNGKVGIKVASPTRDFHVAGEMRVTDLDSDVTPSRIVGADVTGVFDTMGIGTGLRIIGGVLSGTDTTSLSNRINLKLNIADTSSMLTPYLRKADTTAMLTPYLRKVDTVSLSNRINLKLNIADTSSMLTPYLRKVDTVSLSNRINLKLNIADTSSMLTPYLRKVDTVSLSNRINLKLNIADTSSMLTPYLRKADTTAMLTPYLRKVDTASLSNRINLKLNIADTSSMLTPYLRKVDTLSLSNRINNAEAMYVSIVIFAPDDTVVNSSYSKDFFIVPQGLNGYCIDAATIKALAGTGTADIQIQVTNTNYLLSSISGTTTANADTNISLSTGNVLRGNIENLSGTLVGLGLTLELKKTCN